MKTLRGLAATLIALATITLPATVSAAQTSCDLTVSTTSVVVGTPVTITATEFSGALTVEIYVDGSLIHQAAPDTNGTVTTTHAFSNVGTFVVSASSTGRTSCEAPRRIVTVTQATTTSPSTTTTTTTAPAIMKQAPAPTLFGGATCSVTVYPYTEDFPVVLPGEMFHLEGTGFVPGPIIIGSTAHGVTITAAGSSAPVAFNNQLLGSPPGLGHYAGDGTGVPDGNGEIHVEITVPDWPEGWYLMEVTQPHPVDPCTATFTMYVDQPADPSGESCSIQILGMASSGDLPWFLEAQWVTYGFGFTPGEFVVMSLANSPDVHPQAILFGPAGPVEDDGTFVFPFAPPKDAFTTNGPAEWWARSPSCETMKTLGTGSLLDPPEFTITEEALHNAGIILSPGTCDLIAYEEHLDPVAGVDPEYQHPTNEDFLTVFGSGFSPGAEIGFLVDGTSVNPTTVSVDGAGNFSTSAASLPLYALHGQGYLSESADPPFVLSTTGDVCATSVLYDDGGSAPNEITSPQVTIGDAPGTGQPLDAEPGEGDSMPTALLFAVVGLGGVLGGFGGGSLLARRSIIGHN